MTFIAYLCTCLLFYLICRREIILRKQSLLLFVPTGAGGIIHDKENKFQGKRLSHTVWQSSAHPGDSFPRSLQVPRAGEGAAACPGSVSACPTYRSAAWTCPKMDTWIYMTTGLHQTSLPSDIDGILCDRRVVIHRIVHDIWSNHSQLIFEKIHVMINTCAWN